MLTVAAIFLLLALFVSLLRLVTAKSYADRVIVVDIATFQLLGLTILLAIFNENSLPLLYAFMLALLGFISTLILSRLIKP